MQKKRSFYLFCVSCCFLIAVNQKSNADGSKKRNEKTPKILYRRNSDVPDNYLSPDKRYGVWKATGDGEVVTIWLYRVDADKTGQSRSKPPKELSSRHSIIFQRSFIHGVSWIPGKPHSLVFSMGTDNDGGTHGIFLWEGGSRLKRLKHARFGRHGYEEIELAGVTADGKSVIYEYWPNLMEKNPKRFGPFVKRLRLP